MMDDEIRETCQSLYDAGYRDGYTDFTEIGMVQLELPATTEPVQRRHPDYCRGYVDGWQAAMDGTPDEEEC